MVCLKSILICRKSFLALILERAVGSFTKYDQNSVPLDASLRKELTAGHGSTFRLCFYGEKPHQGYFMEPERSWPERSPLRQCHQRQGDTQCWAQHGCGVLYTADMAGSQACVAQTVKPTKNYS